MKKEYMQIRDVEKGRKNLRDFYTSSVDYFSKEFDIPKSDFPKLRIVKGEKASYDVLNNQVTIGDEEFLNDLGDTVGEELGHYVRARITNNVGKETGETEEHAEEFLGFLGSRFLYRSCNPDERNDYFSDGERTFESDYEGDDYPTRRRKLLESSKIKGLSKLKRKYINAEERGETDEIQRIYEEADKLGFREHVSELIHVRPYHFASQLDTERVDWKELYSMPDKEIRSKYFRDNKKSGLEKAVGLISIVFIGFSLALFGGNITGNVISINPLGNNAFGLILLILGLLGIYYYKSTK